jgi:trehalose 6-phosphate phosphatase
MKNILAAPQLEVLAQFAWSNVLIGLDFDGTLAPIVQRPDRARLRARTRGLLVSLAEAYPVAVLSGRGRADVRARLDGVPVRAVVGNHGLEPGADLGACRALVAGWIPSLRKALDDQQGVEIEDKTYSLAVHYRRARARREAAGRIAAAVASLGKGTRVIGGKLVVNVLPSGAPHKGVALMRLRTDLGADTALYVGDDVTDEDVFALDDPGRLLCIRVGQNARSRAPYFVESQRAVDDLLRVLIGMRSAPSHRTADRHGART